MAKVDLQSDRPEQNCDETKISALLKFKLRDAASFQHAVQIYRFVHFYTIARTVFIRFSHF